MLKNVYLVFSQVEVVGGERMDSPLSKRGIGEMWLRARRPLGVLHLSRLRRFVFFDDPACTCLPYFFNMKASSGKRIIIAGSSHMNVAGVLSHSIY